MSSNKPVIVVLYHGPDELAIADFNPDTFELRPNQMTKLAQGIWNYIGLFTGMRLTLQIFNNVNRGWIGDFATRNGQYFLENADFV